MNVRVAAGLAGMVTVCLAGTTCQPAGDGPGLEPRNWPQMNADAGNSGFNPVHTAPLSTTRKWSVQVGPTPAASPVYSPDGNICIGNALGTLVGVSRSGQFVRAKAFIGEVIRLTVVDVSDEARVHILVVVN